MIEDFIDEMESIYSKYKSGMKKAIITKLSGIDDYGERKLNRAVIENYDMGRPPSLKVLMELVYKYKIKVISQAYGGMSVCEFCNYEYDQELITCPKCNKIRNYGAVRLYKMGEGRMHPFEIAERKKQMELLEPSAEEIRKFNEYLANTNGLKGLLWGKIKNMRKTKAVNHDISKKNL